MKWPKTIFIASAALYFSIGSLSIFSGWGFYADSGWVVGISAELFTSGPYKAWRLIDIAPPSGLGLGWTPLLPSLIYSLIILGKQFSWSYGLIAEIYRVLLLGVDILNIYLIVQIISRRRLKVSSRNLCLIILVLFFSGYFLLASGFAGHPETLVLLFSLLGMKFLRQQKFLVSGLFFGLALSAKQSALAVLIPVFFVLFFQKIGFRPVLKFLTGTAAAFLLILFPFLITHPQDVWYGIVEANMARIIRGPNLWWLLEVPFRRFWYLEEMSLFLRRIAHPTLLASIILLSVISIRKKVKFDELNLFGLIAAASLLFNILNKWVSFQHFLLGFVFVFVWDSLRNREGFPVFGTTYALILFVANFLGFPFWQPMVLVINLGAFIYVCYFLKVFK